MLLSSQYEKKARVKMDSVLNSKVCFCRVTHLYYIASAWGALFKV